jgi:hypothetical protein
MKQAPTETTNRAGWCRPLPARAGRWLRAILAAIALAAIGAVAYVAALDGDLLPRTVWK